MEPSTLTLMIKVRAPLPLAALNEGMKPRPAVAILISQSAKGRSFQKF